MKSIILFVVLGIICNIAAAQESYLIVKKSILSSEIVATKEVAVNIKIFNVGASTAYDVQLHDNWDDAKFSIPVGLADAKWDKLIAGGNLSHTYLVSPEAPGKFDVSPAKVTYRDHPKSQVYAVLSTPVKPLSVVPKSVHERQTSAHLQEWGIFFGLSLISVGAPFLYWNHLSRTNAKQSSAKHE